MPALLIGGTHFIGPPLVRRLVGLGHAVAVFHRGRTHAGLPAEVQHILGDRDHLADHAPELRRFRPQAVIDMIAYTESQALATCD
jgi:nucleoside-diphosphate-sugar epimerase